MTDELPFTYVEPEPVIVVERTPRRHRHVWEFQALDVPGWPPMCACGAIQDAVKSKRGKSARNRGNSFEREVAARLGAKRVGQYGTETDVAGDWISVQCKVGGSFPERIWRWLPPAKGDQLRAVVIGDSPGPGHRRRALICLDLDDFVSWYGSER